MKNVIKINQMIFDTSHLILYLEMYYIKNFVPFDIEYLQLKTILDAYFPIILILCMFQRKKFVIMLNLLYIL